MNIFKSRSVIYQFAHWLFLISIAIVMIAGCPFIPFILAIFINLTIYWIWLGVDIVLTSIILWSLCYTSAKSDKHEESSCNDCHECE
jgi:uncharacterized membrane protein YdjX (TVP38/TMEM64 family)